MRSESVLNSSWESARAMSPYCAFQVTPDRAVEHWDRLSRAYESGMVELIDERTWGILEEEDLVPSGGSVLDIGCGTGALTERFARSGASVTGLDISPGMLSLARQRCSRLENAMFVCEDWNAFSAVHGYDLVFSSFCPGVDGLRSILRMEAMSRGKCCLVSLGNGSGDQLAFDAWAELGHPNLSLLAFDPLFPYHALVDMGRRPEIREFSLVEDVEVAREDMVNALTCYMSMFQDLTGREAQVIERIVSERSRNGYLAWREERTVRVLFWSPGSGIRNGSW